MLNIKRAYEKPGADDGVRVLVDRLWPRGLTKDKAKIDLWVKDLAPSNQLRKWFSHDPAKWDEFKNRYFQELKDKKETIAVIKKKIKQETVTLVYGAKDIEHNNAQALKEYLSGSKN